MTILQDTSRHGMPEFTRWRPSALMEYAKRMAVQAHFNLARSGVPSITNLIELPGGPFSAELSGQNYWGHEGLKTTIADWYGTTSEHVLLAQGASQCNFLMAGALLSGGGTAIVETPAYEPILRAVEVWAEQVRRLPRRKADGLQPDPDEFARLLDDRVRLVLLTDLHNPSHVRLEADRLRAIVRHAAAVGATVMLDEVFLPLLERDYRRHGFAEHAISVNSLGKAWGLDSLRVGWAVGPVELVRRAYRLNNLLGVNQPYLTEDLACRILNHPGAVDALIARANTALRGRELFDDFVRATPQIICVPPAGGISGVIELPPATDDVQFAADLAAEDATAVFPGTLFEYPGALRVSFGGPRDAVQEGFARLRRKIQTRYECGKQ